MTKQQRYATNVLKEHKVVTGRVSEAIEKAQKVEKDVVETGRKIIHMSDQFNSL